MTQESILVLSRNHFSMENNASNARCQVTLIYKLKLVCYVQKAKVTAWSNITVSILNISSLFIDLILKLVKIILELLHLIVNCTRTCKVAQVIVHLSQNQAVLHVNSLIILIFRSINAKLVFRTPSLTLVRVSVLKYHRKEWTIIWRLLCIIWEKYLNLILS